MPAFVEVARGPAKLFLSEHRGDARPDTLVYLRVRDVDAVVAEFGATVAEQPCGREVELRDPGGNRLRVGAPRRTGDAGDDGPADGGGGDGRRSRLRHADRPGARGRLAHARRADVPLLLGGLPARVRRRARAVRRCGGGWATTSATRAPGSPTRSATGSLLALVGLLGLALLGKRDFRHPAATTS